MRRALAVLAVIGLVAGCGGSRSSTSRSRTSGSLTTTELTVIATTGSASTVLNPSTAMLRCGDATTGTRFLRDDAGSACALVRRGFVEGVAADQKTPRRCSQVYGGPQHARITGTINGEAVDVAVTRSDGCGTADWQTLQ